MVLLFAEGTTRFFDTSRQRWVISSPSGGGFSWEDLEFVKLSAVVGNSDADAEGYATFLSHEAGHYLHLWHPFYQIALTATENGNRTLSDKQKVDILTGRVTEVLNKELDKGVAADKVVKILDADAAVVSDTPPDDSGELLYYLNRVANGGDACGLLGEVKLTLKNGSPVNYKPDRSLVMSYFKGCLNFNQHFSASQTKRMRNALVNGNRRHLVGVQLGDTSWPNLRFSGLWNAGTQPQVWGPMCSEQQFRDKTSELWGSMRIKQLRGFVLGGQVWYSVLWEPGQYAQVWCPSCSEQDFRNKTGELWGAMRPAQLPPFFVQGQFRFSCLWNAGSEAQVWWPLTTEEQLRQKTGDLWNSMRPFQWQPVVFA